MKFNALKFHNRKGSGCFTKMWKKSLIWLNLIFFTYIYRSLYSIRREHIASRDMSFIPGPINSNDGPASNIEHLIEKNYIVNSRLSNATPEKFPKVIMSQFHRVSGSPNSMSYGMPRPPSRDKFQEVRTILTLDQLNFLNGIIQLLFLELSFLYHWFSEKKFTGKINDIKNRQLLRQFGMGIFSYFNDH